jgi:hypothetical protein
MSNGILPPRRAKDPNNQTNGKWCSADATPEYPGGTCGNTPIRGGTVCKRSHGGGAPQVIRKAEERWREQQALSVATKFLEEDDTISDPHEVLLKRLRHAGQMVFLYATMLQPIFDEGERMVRDEEIEYRGLIKSQWISLGETGYMEHTTDPLIVASGNGFKDHPWVLKLEHWCDKHAYYAKLCIDAKVDERRLQIAESYAQEFIRLMEASFARLGLPPEKRQQERLAIAQDSLRLSG